MLLGQRAQALRTWSGNRFGQVEFIHRLVLAEIRTVMQFLQQHQLGALRGGLGHTRRDDGQIGLGVAVVVLLDQRDGKEMTGHGSIQHK